MPTASATSHPSSTLSTSTAPVREKPLMPEPQIAAIAVEKAYRKGDHQVPVLHGVDIRIERGQTVGLLGRNGMGKSTLIRTLLGHVTQRSGEIRVFGEDVSRSRPHQVARLGVAYVPEGRGVFPNLTVRENLLMAARPGWDALPAVRNGEMYESKSPLILQPGPAALTDGLDALHRICAGWMERSIAPVRVRA